MKRIIISLAIVAIAAALFAAPVENVISFQGKLVEAGVPVDGTRNIEFKLYDASTGGVALWTENHLGVNVVGGLFNVELGGATTFESEGVDFTEQYWIGISVEGGAEITPRYKLTGTPYSMADGDWVVDGGNLYSAVAGSVGIGTDSPETKLHIYQVASNLLTIENPSGSAFINIKGGSEAGTNGINFRIGSTSDWKIQNLWHDLYIYDSYGSAHDVMHFQSGTGNVGIGTDDPTEKLVVWGADALIDSITIGHGGGSVNSNTALGKRALRNNTAAGTANTAIGYKALASNTDGICNTAIGVFALASNNGSWNTACGNQALNNNTVGTCNSAFGLNALIENTTGTDNTAIGDRVLSSNVGGRHNTGVGYKSLLSNVEGRGNVAAGYQSAYNVLGDFNTAIGDSSLFTATTANNNVAIGWRAGMSITTGSNNIVIGTEADVPSPTGDGQISIGDLIYGNMSTNRVGIGISNPGYQLHIAKETADADMALTSETADVHLRIDRGDGSDNAEITYLTGGSANWHVGMLSNGNYQISRTGAGDATFVINTSNRVGIGVNPGAWDLQVNGSAAKPGGGSWTSSSDRRLKDIHGEFDRGLDAIMALEPVYYNYKANNPLELPSDMEYIGLIAQDVQEVIPEAVTRTDQNDYLYVNNDPIIMSMLNAIKELNSTLHDQQNQIDDLKTQNDELRNLIEALEADK